MVSPGDSVEHPEVAALRLAIEDAIVVRNSGVVVELLRGSPWGLKALEGGFGGGLADASRWSFATYCLQGQERREPELLKAVLDSQLGGPSASAKQQLLAAVCCVSKYSHGSLRSGPSDHSPTLFHAAFAARSPAAINLALEYAGPDAKSAPSATEFWRGSIHFECLATLLVGLTVMEREDLEEKFECLRLMREAGMELRSETSGLHGTEPVVSLFVRVKDSTRDPGLLGELFGLYAKAGLVDLDTPIWVSNQPPKQIHPLEACFRLGNAAMTVALIEHGCSMQALSDASKGFDGDAVALLRHVGQPVGIETHAAALTEALMRRRIRDEAPPRDTAAPATLSPPRRMKVL